MRITAPAVSTTRLSLTRTEPGSQVQVIDALIAASQAWTLSRDFVAGALLRSLDGERVVAYLHYTPETEPRDAAPELASDGESTDSHQYTIVSLEAPPNTLPAPLDIAPGDGKTTLINIFDTTPSRQQQLVDLWLSAGKPLTTHPGFVAAALHRSVDGTRVVNYAHWRSPSDWLDVVRQHRQDFERFRPLGQSDPHLYEVVHMVEAAR